MIKSKYRVCYLVSHPIQYQAPLLRRIAEIPYIELTVVFETLVTASAYHDDGFGRQVEWDLPLTEGYAHQIASSNKAIENLLKTSDVLWVHGWDSNLRRKTLSIASKARIPTLMRGENTLIAMPKGSGLRSFFKRYYLKRIFRCCSGFLCIGTDNRNYYKSYGIDTARLFSMPYSVDNEYFNMQAMAAASRREEFRQSLGLQPNRPIILFAGKLLKRKHPLSLFKAWKQLDHKTTRYPYLIYVGDGRERAELETLSASEKSLKILGFRNQSELPAFYDLADVFVLPSKQEPWGLSINEAMACNTAVITSDQCGCSSDLVDESCGIIFPAGNVDALTSALSGILSQPGRAEKMGEAAWVKVSQWSFDQSIEGLTTAIKAVCPPPRKA